MRKLFSAFVSLLRRVVVPAGLTRKQQIMRFVDPAIGVAFGFFLGIGSEKVIAKVWNFFFKK